MTSAPQLAIPAVYMRGGTSRALMFHARDLPGGSFEARDSWLPVFMAALGSPDPHERQLDGLGGGISSLSKIAVMAPSDHPDVDVDYLFGQVSIKGSTVSYRGNCGNISSAVGPFAVDEGLVDASGSNTTVRIRHVESGKIIHATFQLESGKAAVSGDFEIQGVAGSAAPIRLDFLDPGGSATGQLLPTSRPRDTIEVDGVGQIEVSLVDAANPVVFVFATSLGLLGDESSEMLSADKELLSKFEALRAAAAVRMGLVSHVRDAYTDVINIPLVALISRTTNQSADLCVRMISTGQPHKALPLTGAMCTAVAARFPDTLVAKALNGTPSDTLRIAHPSGILPVDAEIIDGVARRVSVFRTARRLMDGRVYVPR